MRETKNVDKSRNVIEDDVEIPFKITEKIKKKIKIKSDALTFFCEKKKRVFTVIIYRTPYPLRIISKGKDLEKMSYGND